MRPKLLAIAVAAVLTNGLAATAQASDWIPVYKTSAEVVSVDRSSAVTEGQVINVWIDYETNQSFQESGVNFDRQVNRMKINCASWQQTSTTKIQWLQGQPVSEWQGNEPFQDILIDTPFEAIAKRICGKA